MIIIATNQRVTAGDLEFDTTDCPDPVPLARRVLDLTNPYSAEASAVIRTSERRDRARRRRARGT
jgi:hypothetical protein